jgi:hypothetical protein
MFLKVALAAIISISVSEITARPTFAQKPNVKSPATSSQKASEENLNKKDAKNRKQGMWFYERPAQFGDPGFYEFGAYENDKKTGMWYKVSHSKELMAIENYKLDVLDGPAQYFEGGNLAATGNYRGIFTTHKYDSFMVRNPANDLDTLIILPAETGYTKHGLWRFYDSRSGQLVLEQEYQVDFLIRERRFETVGSIKNKNISVPKLPHEGGKTRGWSTGKGKSKNSLIK